MESLFTKKFNSVDVYQMNKNFYNQGDCCANINDPKALDAGQACDVTMENNCNANGGFWDPDTCTCTDPTGCDQIQANNCYSNGGNWNSDICTCESPQYYYGGGGGYYCQYECYDYYTAVSGDGGETWEYEYKGRDCYQTGCYYY